MVAQSATIAPSSADFPQVEVDGRGKLHALWTDGKGGAWLSASANGGATWTEPARWQTTSQEVEKFALTRLQDGRILVAWLDGRTHATESQPQQLFARVIGDATEVCVDTSVCDCCQTTLVPFLDGGALLAYRGRTKENVRDIMTARLSADRWGEPQHLGSDDWRIAACPVNGPRLATDGSRVGAAWFTGAGNEPRVLASFSPDAGGRWLMPLRIDRGHPVGHVETILLRDGALLALWLETDGSLWLRRITPEFSANEPVSLAPAGTALARGVPRAVLLDDYAGAKSAARLIVAYTATSPTERERTTVKTLLVTVPEGELVAAERNCDCAPTLAQLEGFAIRGRILDADPSAGTTRIAHEEVPGVLARGTHVFQISPEQLATLHTGAEFIGRIDRGSDGGWRLREVRLLDFAAPSPHGA